MCIIVLEEKSVVQTPNEFEPRTICIPKFSVEIKPVWWSKASAEEIGETVKHLIKSYSVMKLEIDPHRLEVVLALSKSKRSEFEGEEWPMERVQAELENLINDLAERIHAEYVKREKTQWLESGILSLDQGGSK